MYAFAGDSITLTFNANPGSTLTNVVIDGVAQGAITSYTFENISSDHEVIAIFVMDENINAEPLAPEGTPLFMRISDDFKKRFHL